MSDELPQTPDDALARAIVSQSPDALIVSDPDGRIVVWNASAERLFGYAAAEVINQSLDIIIPERLRQAHWDGFNRALSSGVTKTAGRALTTRSMRKDGSTLYVDVGFSLLKNDAGTVIGALACARDCTERFAAEKALRARAAELEKRISERQG